MPTASIEESLSQTTAPAASQQGDAQFFGAVSSNFVESFMRGLNGFSIEERQVMARAGVRFCGGRSMADIRQAHGPFPHNDFLGRTDPNHFKGLYLPSTQTVAVAESTLSTAFRQDDYPAPSAASFAAGIYTETPGTIVTNTTCHEASHAVDNLVAPNFLSSSPIFAKAVQADIDATSGKEDAVKEHYPCFFGANGFAHNELFAELFALTHGANMKGKGLAQDFPRTYELVEDISKAFGHAAREFLEREKFQTKSKALKSKHAHAPHRDTVLPATPNNSVLPSFRSQMWLMLYSLNGIARYAQRPALTAAGPSRPQARNAFIFAQSPAR